MERLQQAPPLPPSRQRVGPNETRLRRVQWAHVDSFSNPIEAG